MWKRLAIQVSIVADKPRDTVLYGKPFSHLIHCHRLVCYGFKQWIVTSPAGAVAKYCDEYVCLSVCLFVCTRKRQSGTTRANFTDFSVHVAYVRGSVLLRHVDDRPHRLSAGRGDGSAQSGRSVIYSYCVVTVAMQLLGARYLHLDVHYESLAACDFYAPFSKRYVC